MRLLSGSQLRPVRLIDSWTLFHPAFSRQVIEKARQKALSESVVLDFVRHAEGLKHDVLFDAAQAAVVDEVIARASSGDSPASRLGTKTDMVYVNTGDGIRVVDPARREVLAVSAADANAMLGASLQEHVAQQPPGARFFSAYPTDTNDLVFITGQKRLRIAQGEPTQGDIRALTDLLLSTAPGDADVIFTEQPQLTAEHRGRIRDLLFQVADEARLQGRRVLMDDLSTTTRQRAAAIRSAKLQDSIVALVADGSFNVSDAKVIQNLEEELVAGGIRVVHVDGKGAIAQSTDTVAVVITGHSDEELHGFVNHAISENALSGKMVIFNSCRTPLSEGLIREMIHRGGATGVYRFDGTIQASQVRRFMRQVLRGRQEAKEPSLMNVIESSGASHQLKGLWHISRAERRSTTHDEHV
jgi:hypothetical protein